MIRTAKSKSLPVTARPRAQEFTTKIVSTWMSLTDIALSEIIAGKLTYESLEADGA